MVRTPSCDKNGMKKGTWTPEEDRKLVAYVTRYGCWNWRQLPKFAGLKRCGKSCRLRWMNYLRPNLKRGNYTKEEEDTIIRLHQSMGNKWSTIAAELPGRTDNEVKNYWHTHLKKRLNDDSNDSLSEEEVEEEEQKQEENSYSSEQNESHSELQKQDSSDSIEFPNNQTAVSTSSGESSYNNYSNNINTNDNVLAVNSTFEVYSEFSDEFWSEPFLSYDSYVPNDFNLLSSSIIDFDEFYSLELDANYFLLSDESIDMENV